MEKKFFAICFVVILVVSVGYLGYVFGQKQALPPAADINDLDKLVNSELIKYFSALVSGEVVSASGTTLIIQNQQSKSSFDTSEDTVFYKQPKQGSVSAEEIKLEDLKPGDPVNVSISFGKEGKIDSLNVMVLQPSSAEQK